MSIAAIFEHAWLAACEANRALGYADPTPTSIDVAKALRDRAWQGTAADVRALARQLGAKLADV